MPVQDLEWLTTWADSVVHASTTDTAERAVAATATGIGTEVQEGAVQARRRAMKATIREKYGFRSTAKQWAREIEAARH